MRLPSGNATPGQCQFPAASEASSPNAQTLSRPPRGAGSKGRRPVQCGPSSQRVNLRAGDDQRASDRPGPNSFTAGNPNAPNAQRSQGGQAPGGPTATDTGRRTKSTSAPRVGRLDGPRPPGGRGRAPVDLADRTGLPRTFRGLGRFANRPRRESGPGKARPVSVIRRVPRARGPTRARRELRVGTPHRARYRRRARHRA